VGRVYYDSRQSACLFQKEEMAVMFIQLFGLTCIPQPRATLF
jgi:hypothetical protein